MRQLVGQLQLKFPNENHSILLRRLLRPPDHLPFEYYTAISHSSERSHNYSVQRSLYSSVISQECRSAEAQNGSSIKCESGSSQRRTAAEQQQFIDLHIRTQRAPSNEIILLQFALIQCTSSGDASVSVYRHRPCASGQLVTALVNGR